MNVLFCPPTALSESPISAKTVNEPAPSTDAILNGSAGNYHPQTLCLLHNRFIPSMMRRTLRRSCDRCAKAKASCDLRVPCTRCLKRKATDCVYANEPLTSTLAGPNTTVYSRNAVNHGSIALPSAVHQSTMVSNSFDPFDSYPQTRLPRAYVQQLMQHCKCSPMRDKLCGT